MVQLSHLYMTTGKTTALTMWIFVGKVMSLLFNTLSRFVIAFLPRSKCLLILWLLSPSARILEPKKIKSVTVTTLSPSICHEVICVCVYIKNKLPWWLRWERIYLQCRRPRFNPSVRKIPWRREWQPTPVFMPGELHGEGSLVGYSLWDCRGDDQC